MRHPQTSNWKRNRMRHICEQNKYVTYRVDKQALQMLHLWIKQGNKTNALLTEGSGPQTKQNRVVFILHPEMWWECMAPGNAEIADALIYADRKPNCRLETGLLRIQTTGTAARIWQVHFLCRLLSSRSVNRFIFMYSFFLHWRMLPVLIMLLSAVIFVFCFFVLFFVSGGGGGGDNACWIDYFMMNVWRFSYLVLLWVFSLVYAEHVAQ